MKSIIKTLLFGMFLLVAIGVKAQEKQGKYEYATLRTDKNELISFTTSEKTERTKIDPKENELALVKKLEELNVDGWDLFFVSETENPNTLFKKTFYLRRKKG